MKIRKSTSEDIETIFNLYRSATAYQKTKFKSNVWPEFDRSLVETEIAESRQFKLLIDNTIVCVWAITFEDPLIWEEKNDDPAVYIHRIATHPNFRGQKFVTHIVNWAKPFALKHHKRFIRLDTCGHNESLIAYYTQCGFTFQGFHKIKDFEALPSHYHEAEVCFFEIDLTQSIETLWRRS